MNELVEVAKRAKAEGDRQELYRAVENLVMVLEGYGLERAQIVFMRFSLAGGKPEQALRSAELAAKRLQGHLSFALDKGPFWVYIISGREAGDEEADLPEVRC